MVMVANNHYQPDGRSMRYALILRHRRAAKVKARASEVFRDMGAPEQILSMIVLLAIVGTIFAALFP